MPETAGMSVYREVVRLRRIKGAGSQPLRRGAMTRDGSGLTGNSCLGLGSALHRPNIFGVLREVQHKQDARGTFNAMATCGADLIVISSRAFITTDRAAAWNQKGGGGDRALSAAIMWEDARVPKNTVIAVKADRA